MLAFGTVAVLARVIAVLSGITFLTGVEMAAENGRTAVTNIIDSPVVTGE
jgi:hypothetical protein